MRRVGLAVLACLAQNLTEAATPAEGKGLLERKCSVCHPAAKALAQAKTLTEWRGTVERMAGKAADHLSATEAEQISVYLAENAGQHGRRTGVTSWAAPVTGAATWAVALGTMLAGVFRRKLGSQFRFHKFGALAAVLLWVLHFVCVQFF